MEILDMLVEMNKEINACIASETAKCEEIEKEREILQENMTREIRSDLMKYLEYYKKLGIKKSVLCSEVELNPIGLQLGGNYSYVGVEFLDESVWLKQMVSLTKDYSCYNGYGIWNTKMEKWGRRDLAGDSLNIIYENWTEIKNGIEKKIAEEYMKQKTAECRKLNSKMEEVKKMLKTTNKLLNM